MRLPISVLAALLALPATAHAGTIGREGTELVYRADPGVADQLSLVEREDVIAVKALDGKLRLGPGCAERPLGVECPTAGLSGLTILTGDGADEVDAFAALPLTAQLGDGNDQFHVSDAPRATIDSGPGDDSGTVSANAASILLGDGDDGVEVEGFDNAPGPYAVDGGAGDDEISLMHRGPGMTLTGGDGNDRLYATAQGPFAVAIACGPGADRWIAAPRDTPGDGCAAHLAGISTPTVSSVFREGALSDRAAGSVTLKRREGLSAYAYETIARATFSTGPGPLRLTLKRTRAGTRRLRRTPHLPVFVTIVTRTGTDRGEVTYRSKVG